jgi:hypothetical protein
MKAQNVQYIGHKVKLEKSEAAMANRVHRPG